MSDAQKPSESNEVPLYTASAVGFQASSWILRLMFGEVTQGDNVGSPAPQLFKIAIGLPWPLAKLVHRYLGLAIEAYEHQEGTISLPRSAQTSLEEAVAKSKK